MKIKWLVQGLACSSVLFCSNMAAAADTLLAQVPLQLTAEQTVTAELWGDRLSNGYANDLLVMIKDKDKKLLTAHAPSIKGGYNCQLQPIKLWAGKSGRQQLLVSAAQGDWHEPSEYRVLSFANKKNVREVFGAAESMGLVTQAYAKDGKMHVALIDGNKSDLTPATGSEVEDGKLEYGGLHSLVAHDVDNDGTDELLGCQQLVQKKQPLADVGAIWKQDKKTKEWKQFSLTIMTLAPTPKDNTVNDGKDFAAGTILVRKMVVPGGEATFPVFAGKDVELQNKMNKLLQDECKDYLEHFYKGEADMAFKVMRADEQILSLQLISGKNSFIHHQLNVNPKTAEKISLDEVLNVKDKDLLPLINLLNTNKKVVYKDRLPDEWYIEGDNLFLMQRIDGVDQVSGFAMGNLHKFLLKKELLNSKS